MAEPELDVAALGKRVRRFRQLRGLEQQDLADQCGISRATIGRLERGEIERPTIIDLRSVARVLNVTMDDLLNERPTSRLTPEDEAELHQLLRRPEMLPDFLSLGDAYDAAPTDEDRHRLLLALRVLAARHRFN
jgi:transcriptional regulator with XRE-family HTH domain